MKWWPEFAAAESDQVRIGRVGPDRDPPSRSPRNGFPHHDRIAGVKATGNVRRTDQSQQLEVGIETVAPEPFAKVGVQVDRRHVVSAGTGRMIRKAKLCWTHWRTR